MADDWNQLVQLANRVDEASESAVRELGEIGRDATIGVVRRRTGNLASGIARGLRVERSDDGATASIESGVAYDAPINARFGHYEVGRAAVEAAQETAERVFERELNL